MLTWMQPDERGYVPPCWFILPHKPGRKPGTRHSLETRKKMSAAQVKSKRPPPSREHLARMWKASRTPDRILAQRVTRTGVPADKLDDYKLYRSKRYPIVEARAAVLGQA